MFLYYGFQAQGIVYFYNEFLQHFEIFCSHIFVVSANADNNLYMTHNKEDENYGYAKKLQCPFANTKMIIINGFNFVVFCFCCCFFRRIHKMTHRISMSVRLGVFASG